MGVNCRYRNLSPIRYISKTVARFWSISAQVPSFKVGGGFPHVTPGCLTCGAVAGQGYCKKASQRAVKPFTIKKAFIESGTQYAKLVNSVTSSLDKTSFWQSRCFTEMVDLVPTNQRTLVNSEPRSIPLPIDTRPPPAVPATASKATHGMRSGHLSLDTFSPVNQNGSFAFDRVLRSGEVNKRTRKTKVSQEPTGY